MSVTGTRTIVRTALWLLLGYLAAITAFFIWGAAGDGAEVLAASVFVIPWLCAPVAAAAATVAASPTRLGAGAFFVAELALVGSFAWLVVQFTYFSTSSTAGLGLLVWPIFQWVAWGAVLAFALLLGWRSRPGWID